MAVPAGGVTPPVPGGPGGAVAVPASAATPPVPPTPPASVGVNGGVPSSPIPGAPGNSLTVRDLLTPPGVLRTVQDAASSVAGVLPPPPAPAPGAPAAVSISAPPVPDGFTPLLATGVSNLISPSPLNLPSIPGMPVPLPNEIPVPSDLLCAGTDWSASQGGGVTRAPAADADVVRAPVVGGDRRDRWEGR
ncbi:hypothetical protein [Mycobacterium kyogaense]|uniref:hypothetical protein n=1 Tax=Mycobacterium kyogaense TaxID=2212479 RepID=UPI001F09597C|nr:hypothetical protein [Mycobacterium kyogaense]